MIPSFLVIWDKLLLNVGVSFSISPYKLTATQETMDCIETFSQQSNRQCKVPHDIRQLTHNADLSACFVSDFSSARACASWSSREDEEFATAISKLSENSWIGLGYMRCRLSGGWLVLCGGKWELVYRKKKGRLLLVRFDVIEGNGRQRSSKLFIRRELL